ncbi:MAG: helix-turn-helix domain-containing protein [Dehalococcoidales bacterium]
MTERREFRSHDTINDAYLWGMLDHARSLVSRARELELSQYGITMEQMSILHALLINNNSATIDEIANFIIRQHNSVSTIVNRMSKIGLVRKERQQHEKKYKVIMTEKARKIVDSVPRKSIEMIFSKISLKDKEQLATCLEQIISTGHDILGHNFNLPFLSIKS